MAAPVPYRSAPADGALAAPAAVALCGWVVPGLGYWLIGERARALIAGGVILATFLAGLLIGGVRVIDVPGYDAVGGRRMLGDGRRVRQVWALSGNPVGEVMNKPWYIAQSLAGPALITAGTWGSLKTAAAGHLMSTARLFDIGTLYTAVAGMLNLLVVIDATYRAANPAYGPTPPPPPGKPTPPTALPKTVPPSTVPPPAAGAAEPAPPAPPVPSTDGRTEPTPGGPA